MQNFVQPGNFITYTAPSGGVVSGGVYKIGQQIVVATVTAAQGDPFTAMIRGVASVPKVGSQAWAEGALVYWNGTAFTTSSSSATLAGTAVVATGSGAGETTGVVYFDGASRVTT